MVTDRRSIVINYLKGWFFFDLTASIPIDLIMWMITTGCEFAAESEQSSGSASRSTKLIRVIKIFRTFRILRLAKLKRVVLTLESFLNLNFSAVSIFKYLFSVFLLAHLLACGFVYCSTKHGWMVPLREFSQSRQYIAALYWAFATMTTMGYGDIAAQTPTERLFSAFCMMVGSVTFTYAITRVVHIVTSMGTAEKHMADTLENVKEWSGYHEFPESLMNDINTYIHYRSSRSYYDEKVVLDGLSLSLKQKVLNFMFEGSLKRVTLFSNSSTLFLTELMARMTSEYAAPFSLIIVENAVADSMYVIRKGFCAVYKGEEEQDTTKIESAIIMGPGQAFGEIALIAHNTTRTANVVALEWNDLAIITRADFEELIDMFPEEKFLMHKYVENRLKKLRCERREARPSGPRLPRVRAETQMLEEIGRKDQIKFRFSEARDDLSSEDSDNAEWIERLQEEFSLKTYKEPLDGDQIEHMQELQAQFMEDNQVIQFESLFQQVQSAKYQWLKHLDADRANREYLNRLPEDQDVPFFDSQATIS